MEKVFLLPRITDTLALLVDQASCGSRPDSEKRIREFFESYGVMIQEWDRVRTDWLTLRAVAPEPEAVPAK